MDSEIDKSLNRLEAATQLKQLIRNLQLANWALLAYAAGLSSSDDHAVNEHAGKIIKHCSKISVQAHGLLDNALMLENADKDEARQRDEDEFMSKLIHARFGGEE